MMELPDFLELKVFKDKEESQVLKVIVALPDHRVSLVLKEKKEIQVNKD